MITPILAAALCLLAPPTSPKPAPQHAQPTPPAAAAHPDTTTGYKLQPGPYATGSANLTLHDPERDKDLEITVRYPKAAPTDPANFPLIVFSHGAGGSRDAFPQLTTHWASHGYIVVLPTHADSIALRRKQGEDVRHIAKNPNSLIRDVKPMDRVADVKLILDSIPTLEDQVEDLHATLPPTQSPAPNKPATRGRIDRDRIAMAGHSAGALTTQMIVGVKVRGARSMEQGKPAGGADLLTARSVADSRVKAGLIISGGGLNNRMLTEDSWNELSVPILTITGSNDIAGIGNETPETRRHSFEYSRGRAKGGPAAYLLWIEGATHSSYAGKGARPAASADDLDLDMVVNATTATTQAFLDAWIKGDQAARDYIEDPARTTQLTGGKAELRLK